MISVIIPYNKDRGFLNKCIESIENQTYQDYEIVLSKSDANVATNFNNGLFKSKGEYCKFVTEDDWLPENSLQLLIDGINGYDWICANALQYDVTTWIYKPYDYADEFLTIQGNIPNHIHGGTTLYKTEMLKSIGGMNEELWTGEEYEMHLRLMSLGYMPGYIDETVYCHRIWPGQKSKQYRKFNKQKRDEEIKRIQSLYSDKI